MVQDALSGGAAVQGVVLPGFDGKIGSKRLDSDGAQLPRLGRELASAARLAGVAGIFHSDELPAYGISETEVSEVRQMLSLDGSDAFVLCVAPAWQSNLALEAVIERARGAYHRIPQEVRNVVIRKGQPADGTTTAMRPLPGGARMYPETDIPILEVSLEHWDIIRDNLPLSTEQRRERLQNLDLSQNQMEAILGSEMDDVLITGAEGGSCGCPPVPAKAWGSAILDNTRSEIAEGTGRDESEIAWPVLTLAVYAREEGIITREGLVPLARKLWLEGPSSTDTEFNERLEGLAQQAEKAGFTPANTGTVDAAVEEVVAENMDMIGERGMGAMGPLMGAVMQKLGGSADGKTVSEALRKKISELDD